MLLFQVVNPVNNMNQFLLRSTSEIFKMIPFCYDPFVMVKRGIQKLGILCCIKTLNISFVIIEN